MKKSKIDFSVYTHRQYKYVISSPSQSQVYFNSFHKPMVESLLLKFRAPIRLLSAACGFGDELEFFKGDGRVVLTGIDISRKMLAVARKNIPNGTFKCVNLSKSRPKENSFEGAIAVNAMIYSDSMVKIGTYMHSSLVEGGMATINFRDSRKPENIPFFEDCIRNGCQDIVVPMVVNKNRFLLRVMDFTSRKDTNSNLGQQAFFQSCRDMEGFLSLIGFEIVSHETYTYESSENKNNSTEVYSLVKANK
ncbi:MAG: methyltransferase domain-containing protein [Candidatus Micrarchaeota archaeon]|nr:methyltransferase domain-containing protein [Candidatus Micrarchaeota archaeon]